MCDRACRIGWVQPIRDGTVEDEQLTEDKIGIDPNREADHTVSHDARGSSLDPIGHDEIPMNPSKTIKTTRANLVLKQIVLIFRPNWRMRSRQIHNALN